MQIPKRLIKPKPRKMVSIGERILASHLDALKIPYTTEFRFHPERKWRSDFRIDGYPILVEVEGGAHSNGRHTRGSGYTADCEKYSQASILGWRVIRGTTEQVKKGLVLKWIEMAMKGLEVEQCS